jgi:acetyl esterase/lipase
VEAPEVTVSLEREDPGRLSGAPPSGGNALERTIRPGTRVRLCAANHDPVEPSGAARNQPPVAAAAPRLLLERASRSAQALVDFHGGGFFFSYAALHLAAAERYAVEGRCRVFFPDYRLSIGHPFPAAFDDCYATLAWVHGNADDLGVDPQRVALIGDSAGGALAAGVAQKAVDRSENPICAQILVYPVTDHETRTESARRFSDTPFWKTASNRSMWKVYLRDSDHGRSGGKAPAPTYAAPLHRESFAGLPPAWIEVAEFDPLLDEGRQYAGALEAAGVPVELRLAKGAIHGYDLVEGSPTALAMFEERMAAIQRYFGQHSEEAAPTGRSSTAPRPS